MRVTRYPQSCLVLEAEGRQLVIDPGDDFLLSHQTAELIGVEAALFTHAHPDHAEPAIAEELSQRGVELVGNQTTAQALQGLDLRIVEDGDELELAGFKVKAIELPHCALPDGSAGPQNTGYVIDGSFFHPGDGYELAGLSVAAMALPIQGPDISMRDAFAFARQLGVKQAIAIHYDKMGAKPEVFAKFAHMTKMPFELRVLGDGESLEL